MSAVRGYAEVAADLSNISKWSASLNDEAAYLLEAIAALLPVCPTCGGTGEINTPVIVPSNEVVPGARFYLTTPCPAGCDHGKVSVAQMAATWQAVHGDLVLAKIQTELRQHSCTAGDAIVWLRSIRPSPSPQEGT